MTSTLVTERHGYVEEEFHFEGKAKFEYPRSGNWSRYLGASLLEYPRKNRSQIQDYRRERERQRRAEYIRRTGFEYGNLRTEKGSNLKESYFTRLYKHNIKGHLYTANSFDLPRKPQDSRDLLVRTIYICNICTKQCEGSRMIEHLKFRHHEEWAKIKFINDWNFG